MSTIVSQTGFFAGRQLRSLLRQPWWIAITLVQPIVWLVLFGALFKSTTEIPGFAGDDFVEFISPGVIVMTGFMASGWAGMGVLNDIDEGIVDRFLVTPATRTAMLLGAIAQGALSVLIQSLIIVLLALLLGASFSGGVLGVAVLLLICLLLSTAVGALSYALALVTRSAETLIAILNFVMLPLVFLSTAFQQKQLMPDWMQSATNFNPLNWAIEASRSASLDVPIDLSTAGGADWGAIGLRVAALALLVVLCLIVANRAFGKYQRQA